MLGIRPRSCLSEQQRRGREMEGNRERGGEVRIRASGLRMPDR